jgi:UDP-glucose 4-epimerase
MRVAVTGATGNVGTALLRSLADDDRISSIVGLARRHPDVTLPKVTWIEADVATDDLRPPFDGADAVVHLAWLFQPTHSPTVTWQANAVGSQRVFDAVAAAEVSTLIHASSVGAYSPAPGHSVDESWPTHSVPHAAYGREKAYVERALDAFEAEHPSTRVVRMRPAFTFQRRAATEQRRIFGGPFVPRRLLRPGRLPRLPVPRGLCFQAVHAGDVAEAYRLALVSDVEGAFNLAAEPPIDGPVLGALLETATVEVPRLVARMAMSVGWHAHLLPADPALLDLILDLPLMDTTRARTELDWAPSRTGTQALHEMLVGMRQGAGGETPPLEPDSALLRAEEVAMGVGERA